MSTARFNTLQNAAATKSVPVDTVVAGSAKAWVNFDGMTTATIRASHNISSVVRNSTGNYTLNFTSAMVDTSFCVAGTAGFNDAASMGTVNPKAFTVGSLQFITDYANGSVSDYSWISVAVFR